MLRQIIVRQNYFQDELMFHEPAAMLIDDQQVKLTHHAPKTTQAVEHYQHTTRFNR